MKRKKGFIFGIIFGFLLDLFIGTRIGINAISLGIVGLAAENLDKNFSKDNRITVMILNSILTVLAEVIIYTLQILFCGSSVQILGFIKIIIIEVVYNAFLMAIIYPFFLALGSKLENDFVDKSFLNF